MVFAMAVSAVAMVTMTVAMSVASAAGWWRIGGRGRAGVVPATAAVPPAPTPRRGTIRHGGQLEPHP